MSGSGSGPGAPPISAANDSNNPSSADSGRWPVKKACATPGSPPLAPALVLCTHL